MADYKITDTEKAAHHLQALADRPNAMTSYKQGKLSADGMKKLFDDNLDFLAEKHNKLGEELEAEHDDRVAKHNELEMKHDELAAEHNALEAKHDELEQSHKKTAAQVETLISESINRIYPIGAVYISFEATSPSDLFGGSWEAIDEGRFLMASKKASGNTGGNKNHLHEMWMAAANMNVDSSGNLNYRELYAYDKNETFMSYTYNKSVPINTYAYESQGEEIFGVRVIGTTDHSDHTPPYVTVYMWRRIA